MPSSSSAMLWLEPWRQNAFSCFTLARTVALLGGACRAEQGEALYMSDLEMARCGQRYVVEKARRR